MWPYTNISVSIHIIHKYVYIYIYIFIYTYHISIYICTCIYTYDIHIVIVDSWPPYRSAHLRPGAGQRFDVRHDAVCVGLRPPGLQNGLQEVARQEAIGYTMGRLIVDL